MRERAWTKPIGSFEVKPGDVGSSKVKYWAPESKRTLDISLFHGEIFAIPWRICKLKGQIIDAILLIVKEILAQGQSRSAHAGVPGIGLRWPNWFWAAGERPSQNLNLALPSPLAAKTRCEASLCAAFLVIEWMVQGTNTGI